MSERSTLAVRIEEASMNAWPAMQQVLLDGWIMRFSNGLTKRTNSIVPLYRSSQNETDERFLDKIQYCENRYAQEQLPTLFRLTSLNNSVSQRLDSLLAARGYAIQERCYVMNRPLHDITQVPTLTFLTLERWLASYCYLTGTNEPASTLHNLILKSIAGQCGFAEIRDEEETVACGLGVIEHDLLGLFDIFTHPERRRTGIGRHIVTEMLAWGASCGATTAYLQVLADNHPALAMYDKLGFNKSHEYWYRIAP